MQRFHICLVYITGKKLKNLSGEVVMTKLAFHYRTVYE
jgi:hypothetical protein